MVGHNDEVVKFVVAGGAVVLDGFEEEFGGAGGVGRGVGDYG